MSELAEPERPQQILPYLNPAYWDGHTLGDGDATPITPNNINLSHKFARQAIESTIHGRAILPETTFRPGETFDPAEHSPGTIVLFRDERLRRSPGMAIDYRNSADQAPLPPRPVAITPSIGPDTVYERREGYGATYRSQLHWGVVPQDNQLGVIGTTFASFIYRVEGGVRVSSPTIHARRMKKAIGTTSHETNQQNGMEWIDRINILHVIGRATYEKRRRRWELPEFLGKLTFGDSHA